MNEATVAQDGFVEAEGMEEPKPKAKKETSALLVLSLIHI